MTVKKFFIYAVLALFIVAPWSTPAVNRPPISDWLHQLGKAKLAVSASIRQPKQVSAETLLVKGLLEVARGDPRLAMETLDQVLRIAPNFKLAHFVRGDLLLMQAQSLPFFGGSSRASATETKDFQDEARARVARYLSTSLTRQYPQLLLSPNVKQSHVIVVDASKSRLFVYKNQNGNLHYLADYYVSVGKNGVDKTSNGDKRTPLGIYFVGQKISQRLPDFYGGVAYPLNYPNEWDVHHNRRGSGIWLHGTPPSTFSRPPRASDGCIVLSSLDLSALGAVLQYNSTPVIIANNLDWQASKFGETEKKSLQKTLQAWLQNWREQNTVSYLSYYSRDFFGDGFDYAHWVEHKTRVQAGKPKVDITISDLSMFGYPGTADKLVMVNFVQAFRSPLVRDRLQKRQYWRLENGTWKIVYEGVVA